MAHPPTHASQHAIGLPASHPACHRAQGTVHSIPIVVVSIKARSVFLPNEAALSRCAMPGLRSSTPKRPRSSRHTTIAWITTGTGCPLDESATANPGVFFVRALRTEACPMSTPTPPPCQQQPPEVQKVPGGIREGLPAIVGAGLRGFSQTAAAVAIRGVHSSSNILRMQVQSIGIPCKQKHLCSELGDHLSLQAFPGTADRDYSLHAAQNRTRSLLLSMGRCNSMAASAAPFRVPSHSIGYQTVRSQNP